MVFCPDIDNVNNTEASEDVKEQTVYNKDTHFCGEGYNNLYDALINSRKNSVIPDKKIVERIEEHFLCGEKIFYAKNVTQVGYINEKTFKRKGNKFIKDRYIDLNSQMLIITETKIICTCKYLYDEYITEDDAENIQNNEDIIIDKKNIVSVNGFYNRKKFKNSQIQVLLNDNSCLIINERFIPDFTGSNKESTRFNEFLKEFTKVVMN